MGILWRDGSGTTRSVQAQIAPRRRIAYTTILTVLARLTETGLLAQGRGGRAAVRRVAVCTRRE